MRRCGFVVLLLGSFAAAAQTPDTAAPPPPIAKIAADAEAARNANRLDEATRLYRKALAVSPTWAEGWWYVGTLTYESNQYQACRDSFRRFVALSPKMAPAYAMLGLCEFHLKEFAQSLTHLERAFSMGLPNEQQLTTVTLYHIALLQTRSQNYERALQLCRVLIRRPDADTPNIVAIAGLAALRRPIFPHELAAEDRELAFKIGNAMVSPGSRPIGEVERLFQEVVTQFPKAPNVHYSYATLLLANDPDRGVQELKKELEIDPKHLPALVSLTFEYLKRGDPGTARPYAERAAATAPGNFAARAGLGRVYLELNDVPKGTRELEIAAKLAPDSPQVHLMLASAYAKAGRKADAARERQIFSKLDKAPRSDGTEPK